MRQPVSAKYVAAVCHRYPSERQAILDLLLRARGARFVHRVLAAMADRGASDPAGTAPAPQPKTKLMTGR